MKNFPIEWNVFEYKFASNPRYAFENLSYAMFCIEFNINYGAFRYFNQPYIETQPVDTHDGYITGFQAKYYDSQTSISSKEEDLKNAIRNSKAKYPDISRFIIYTNKELSSSSEKDKEKPQYQINIEAQGDALGIKIEWRVKSNFEIILNKPESGIIRDLYFNPDPGLQKYLTTIQSRSINLLNSINSDIQYSGQTIKLYRSSFNVFEFIDSNSNVCIVYGGAGTGKSGLIKDIAKQIQEETKNTALVSFSASDFDAYDNEHVLSYGNYCFDDFLKGYSDSDSKICIIESAEKYCIFQKPVIFKNVINRLIKHKWKLIITIREPYLTAFCGAILENNVTYKSCSITRIQTSDLLDISEKYNFSLPEDNRLKDLLCNLFYLKLYLSIIKPSDTNDIDIESFIEKIWRQVIRNESVKVNNLPARREKVITGIVFSLFNKDSYVYKAKADDDWIALNDLAESGIISCYNDSGDLWVLNHDIYEEIVCNHILSYRFSEEKKINKIVDGFGQSYRCRKMYRIWLNSRLKYADENLFQFILCTLNSKCEQSWKDETIIAVISSSNREAIEMVESLMGYNQFELFTRTVFLLNTACRIINIEFLKLIDEKSINTYRFTKPSGQAWDIIFNYIYNNHSVIPWTQTNLNIVCEALYSWASSYPRGKTTRLAGLIALQLKTKCINKEIESSYRYNNETEATIDRLILESAFEIKEELKKLMDAIISNNEFHHRITHYNLLEKSLSNIFDSGKIGLAIPSTIIKLAKKYWFYTKNNNHYSSLEMNGFFGLNENMSQNYYPSSAFQTPVYFLLSSNFRECVDFIIETMNVSAEQYKNSSLNSDYNECQEIEINLSEKETIKQIASYRLWNIHRGTEVSPDVLRSILMALEKYLLEQFETLPDEKAVEICLYLIRKSNNVSITSLVVSLVTAFPEKLFEVSCILIKTKEIFDYDLHRVNSEIEANFCRLLQGEWEKYNKERLQSNNLPFRKTKLEDVILNYQFHSSNLSEEDYIERRKKIFDCIDAAKVGIESWDPNYQFAYFRIDIRNFHCTGAPIEKDGKTYIAVESKLPNHLEAIREDRLKETDLFSAHSELMLWAANKYKGDNQYKQYTQFETNPKEALIQIMEICELDNRINEYTDRTAVIYTSAIMLRDYKSLLSTDERKYCMDIILNGACYVLIHSAFSLSPDEYNAIVCETARMASSCDFEANTHNPCFLLIGLMIKGMQLFDYSWTNPLAVVWQENPSMARQMIYVFVYLVTQYRGDKDIIAFTMEHAENITMSFSTPACNLEKLEIDGLNYNELMYLSILFNNTDDSQLQYVIKIGQCLWAKMFAEIVDYQVRKNYQLESFYKTWLSDFLLNLPQEKQNELVQVLMAKAQLNRDFNGLLTDIILSQNALKRYKSFWHLWTLLQESIVQSFENDKGIYLEPDREFIIGLGREDVIVTYLLYNLEMDVENTEFQSIRSKMCLFFATISSRLGFNPTIIFAISKMLNTSGKGIFENEGVTWLSGIISNNPNLSEASLHTNTIYYLEEYILSYVKKMNFSFRTNTDAKKKAMIILDYLVSKGSTVGFLLREEIL